MEFIELKPEPRRRWPWVLAAFFVVGGALGYFFLGRADTGPVDPFEAAVDSIVETAMAEGPISGVSVTIASGIRLLHAKGYGYADIENELPATPRTIYKIGSITKQFTAAAIMQLHDEGDIDLQAPVSEYLPQYPEFSGVTVEQLLTHTGGVRDFTTVEGWWQNAAREVTPQEMVEVFRDAPSDFAPGSRFGYSNSGYILLGLIIEAVAERPYGSYLNEFLFVANELEETAYCDDRRLVPNRARGYSYGEDGSVQHAIHVSMTQAYAAGAICASALDLTRWSRILASGRVTGRDGYDAMSTPATLGNGARIEYGYGLAVSYLEGHHRISHVGGMIGFTGQAAHYGEDDVTIVVLTNTDRANAAKIESDIARLIFDIGAIERVDLAIDQEQLARYQGRYDLEVTEVEIFVLDDHLNVDVDLQGLEGRYVLLNEGDHVFRVDGDSEVVIRFSETADGVDGFVLERHGLTLYGRRMN